MMKTPEQIKKYNENRKKKYHENKEPYLIKGKKWREDNKEKVLESARIKGKKYREANKEKRKLYRESIKEKQKIYSKEYQLANKEKRKIYVKKRKEIDKVFALSLSMRTMVAKAFSRNGFSRTSKTETVLGCSFDEFKIYLENQFLNWMSWNNKGLYNGEFNYGWDIDHKTPLSSAKTEEELIQLCHYTNLQPLCTIHEHVSLYVPLARD